MNRNRIIKVILGVLTVLPVVWFCVLFYQDGYARDYGIYRSRTLLLMAVVLLLCCVVLFFFQTAYIQSMANGLGVLAFCAAFVGVQGLIEAIVCFLLSVPISKALLHLTGTRQKPESI